MSLRRSLATLVVVGVAWIGGDARAEDDRAVCVGAYEQGQVRRKEGRLVDARGELATCSRDVCPEIVRRECLAWLRDLEPTIPSIVVGARTPAGDDVIEASLLVDGRVVQPKLTGAPLEIDPGEHRIAVRRPGGAVAEKTILVSVGEKNRLLSLVLPDASVPPSPAPPPPDRGPAAAVPSPLPWVLGGVGVALAGVGVTLDLVGTSDLEDLRERCAPACASADVERTRRMIIGGDVLLLLGAASIALGSYLLLRRPASPALRETFRW